MMLVRALCQLSNFVVFVLKRLGLIGSKDRLIQVTIQAAVVMSGELGGCFFLGVIHNDIIRSRYG